jgi:hypothetical protein
MSPVLFFAEESSNPSHGLAIDSIISVSIFNKIVLPNLLNWLIGVARWELFSKHLRVDSSTTFKLPVGLTLFVDQRGTSQKLDNCT